MIVEQLVGITQSVENGHMNALEAYIELKTIEKALKGCLSDLKDEAVEEARKYGKGEHEVNGATVQLKSGGGRWSYKGCEWWEDYQVMQKQAQTAYKQLETGVQMVDSDGAVITPAEYMPNAETITVKI